MSKPALPEYFVSYCVVKGSKTNPFGHSYLVFSKLDPNLGKKARPEVFEALGFYGHPHQPNDTFQHILFPAKLFGPGHIIREHLRFLIKSPRYSHQHRTWQISKAQCDELLQGYIKDRNAPLPERDFRTEYKESNHIFSLYKMKDPVALDKYKQQEDQLIKTSGGPYFNIYKHSCMTDAKRRLLNIGIENLQMKEFIIDIPGINSGTLNRMELSYDEATDRVYWSSPFVLTAPKSFLAEDKANRERIVNLQIFSILHDAILQINALFNDKMQQLEVKKLHSQPLTDAHIKLNKLTKELAELSPFLNKINHALNHDIEMRFGAIISECKQQLTRQENSDPELLRFVQQLFQSFVLYITEAIHFFGYLDEINDISHLSVNSLSEYVSNKIGETKQQIRTVAALR